MFWNQSGDNHKLLQPCRHCILSGGLRSTLHTTESLITMYQTVAWHRTMYTPFFFLKKIKLNFDGVVSLFIGLSTSLIE